MATWRAGVIWQCAHFNRNPARKNTYMDLDADVGVTKILNRNQYIGVA
jgi:hypothetical protein